MPSDPPEDPLRSRRRRLVRRLISAAILLVLLVVVVAYLYVSPILSAGSGYAAKNLCSGVFLSGMAADDVHRQALIGASSLLANLSYTIDRSEETVRTRLFGWFPRTARHREALGCTLLPAGEDSDLARVDPLEPEPLDQDAPWPLGSAPLAEDPRLQDMVARAFVEEDPERPRNTKAVVVVHDGRLVAEQYAEGVGPETPLLGWSMTKSVTNLLIGLMVGDGLLRLDEPAPVPAWRQDGDPRGAITIDELLRMSSGLEFSEIYGPSSDVTHMLSNEADTGGFAASKPLVFEPDTHWSYASGTSNILAGILRRALGGETQALYDFAQRRLFGPLGVTTATMEVDASGTPIGSSYMYASARDWARLGQFCLQDGVWDGERLLPEGWMEYSTTPTSTDRNNQYGAHFWLNREPSDADGWQAWPELPEDTYYMSGYQGQHVLVIPSRHLVVVRLGFTPARNHGLEELVSELLEALPDLVAVPAGAEGTAAREVQDAA